MPTIYWQYPVYFQWDPSMTHLENIADSDVRNYIRAISGVSKSDLDRAIKQLTNPYVLIETQDTDQKRRTDDATLRRKCKELCERMLG